jgi:molybdopterin converting factor subunit 1
MKTFVALFAIARELVGTETIEVELPEVATVADLRVALATTTPALAEVARRAAIAVDTEYASDTTVIKQDSKLAIIPPVSGG